MAAAGNLNVAKAGFKRQKGKQPKAVQGAFRSSK